MLTSVDEKIKDEKLNLAKSIKKTPNKFKEKTSKNWKTITKIQWESVGSKDNFPRRQIETITP